MDPSLREIRIRFNQPMDPTAWLVSPGSANYPEIIDEPRWADEQTFVLPIRVQPNRMYEVMINMADGTKFRNRQGHVIPSTVINSQTGAKTDGPSS